MDGHHTPSQINELIYKVTPYTGPNSILTEAFIRLLEDTSSDVFQTLEKYNAYNGWAPQMPMKLFHNALDDLVPAGNLEMARAYFPDLPNLEYEFFYEYIEGLGPVHGGALPFAYVKDFLYLDRFASPERHKP